MPPDRQCGFSRVLPIDDVPVGCWPMAGRQAEDRFKGDVPIKSTVVAKDKFIQVRIDMLAAEPMIGAEAPSLQKGEDSVDPFQRNVPSHFTNHARIVAVAGEPGIGCMAVRHQGRARRDIRLDEGVDMLRLVARNRRETAAARHRIKVLRSDFLGFLGFLGRVVDDLDSTDDQHFAGLGDLEEAIVGAEWHLRLIDLDDALQLFTLGVDHRSAELLGQQPRRLVGAKAKLPHELLGRHPIRMRRHQMGRPEPRRQRKLGSVHHGPGGHRGLLPACSTLVGICPAPQEMASCSVTAWTNEPIRPPLVMQKLGASRLVGEAPLEFKKRVRAGHRPQSCPPDSAESSGTWDNGISLVSPPPNIV